MKLCSSHVRRRTLPAEKPTILPSSTQYGETSGGKKPGLEYLTIIATTTTPLPFALPSKGERLPTRRAELKRILSAADRCYGKKGPLDENFSDFSSPSLFFVSLPGHSFPSFFSLRFILSSSRNSLLCGFCARISRQILPVSSCLDTCFGRVTYFRHVEPIVVTFVV